MPVPLVEMEKLVGWQFPGGTFTVEHWENHLLHDVTEAGPPTGGIGHPVYAFHAPLAGMGISYAEFFVLCRAESDDAVRAGEYDFEYRRPLHEGETYRVEGEILGVERKTGKRAGMFDIVTFRLALTDSAGEVALVATNSWLFLRSQDQ